MAGQAEAERFQLRGRIEIAYLLRELQRSGAPLTIILDDGKDFLVSSVLEADGASGTLVLDAGSRPELNERLLREGTALVAASPEGVSVRFEVRGITPATADGRLTLRMPFPEQVVKLQRREAFRLRVIDPLQVTCVVPVADDTQARLYVMNLSVTGLSLTGEFPGAGPAAGRILADCRLRLPEEGEVSVSLHVRHLRPATEAQPPSWGTEFVALGSDQEALIQRFLIRAQRRLRPSSE